MRLSDHSTFARAKERAILFATAVGSQATRRTHVQSHRVVSGGMGIDYPRCVCAFLT